jgi:hypothetical protein
LGPFLLKSRALLAYSPPYRNRKSGENTGCLVSALRYFAALPVRPNGLLKAAT